MHLVEIAALEIEIVAPAENADHQHPLRRLRHHLAHDVLDLAGPSVADEARPVGLRHRGGFRPEMAGLEALVIPLQGLHHPAFSSKSLLFCPTAKMLRVKQAPLRCPDSAALARYRQASTIRQARTRAREAGPCATGRQGRTSTVSKPR